MTVETAPFINGLNSSYPTGATSRGEADDHLRLIKSAVKATFPNVTGAVTVTHTELNKLAGLTETVGDKLQQFSLSISNQSTRLSAVETAVSTLSLSVSALVASLSVIESTYLKIRSVTVVTTARTIGTKYINSATYPIWVQTQLFLSAGGSAKLLVTSITVATAFAGGGDSFYENWSYPVASGETYQVAASNSVISGWVERR